MLDTIVALSSGALPSGIAVVRISGPLTQHLFREIIGEVPEPRRMIYRAIGTPAVDSGLAVYFAASNSFTGEDSGELQVHGSRAVVAAVLAQLTERGARLALPGEFTRRAFENGKLDLTEVEGLGDLIAAETDAQRGQALARMNGAISDQLEEWRAAITDLRAELEARIDFSDEGDVSALPSGFIIALESLRNELDTATATVRQGRIVREGFRVALAGPPNAGKSSLLNRLSSSEVAIVSDEPGTTRDVKEVQLDLGGQLIVLVDTAGLRETESAAEGEGVRRARREIDAANVVLWLRAPDVVETEVPPEGAWVVGTKSDMGGTEQRRVSAATGEGVPALLDEIRRAAVTAIGIEPVVVSRERDRRAFSAAAAAIGQASAALRQPEIAAEHLRIASAALERLIGRIDAEAVLDRLFVSFCIGK